MKQLKVSAIVGIIGMFVIAGIAGYLIYSFQQPTNISGIKQGVIATTINKGWTLLGPSDGRVNGIAISRDNKILAASNSGGVFLSRNGGKSWIQYSNGLDSHRTNSIKKIGNDIYVAANDGVYVLRKSRWIKVYSPYPKFGRVLSFSNIGRIIFVLGENGLAKRGNTNAWIELPVPASNLFSLFISSKNTLYISGFDGVYKSTDYGETWSKIFSKAGVFSVAEGLNGEIYLGGADGQLYRSVGSEFMPVPNAPRLQTGIIAYQNGRLLVESYNRLYQSIDNGKTFVLLAQGDNSSDGFWDIRQIIFPEKNKNIVYISHDNGISRYNFVTRQMKKLGSIDFYSEISSLAVNKDQDMATTYWDHFPAKYRASGSKSWANLPVGGESDYIFADYKNSNLFVVRSNSDIWLISTSTVLWSSHNNPIANPKNSVTFGSQGTTTKVYVLYHDQLNIAKIKTFNLTSDMNMLNEEDLTLPFSYPAAIMIDPTNQLHILVIADNKVYESNDDGKTWNTGMVPIYNNEQLSCTSISINPFRQNEYLLSCTGSSGNMVIKVTNGLISMVNLPVSSYRREYVVEYDSWRQGVIYAGSEKGFFYTTDYGKNWLPFNRGLYTDDITVIRPTSDKIYIGTWGSGNAVISKSVLLNPLQEK